MNSNEESKVFKDTSQLTIPKLGETPARCSYEYAS